MTSNIETLTQSRHRAILKWGNNSCGSFMSKYARAVINSSPTRTVLCVLPQGKNARFDISILMTATEGFYLPRACIGRDSHKGLHWHAATKGLNVNLSVNSHQGLTYHKKSRWGLSCPETTRAWLALLPRCWSAEGNAQKYIQLRLQIIGLWGITPGSITYL